MYTLTLSVPSYPNLHIDTAPINLSIIASYEIVTIVDFGAFLGCQLKSTMAPKELIKVKALWPLSGDLSFFEGLQPMLLQQEATVGQRQLLIGQPNHRKQPKSHHHGNQKWMKKLGKCRYVFLLVKG